ncbi:MAG: hypothetical protein WC378_01020 [Opitutaceae bacterium]|jgi:hypothetical protein
MIDWIKNYQFNNLLALYTYWVPLAVCLTVYACRFVRAYREDVKKSAEDYYHPTLTVGAIFGHVLLAVVPAVNLFTMVFDCMGSVFRWLGEVFDIPLVRKKS